MFNEVENGEKEKRFVRGKPFRARAEFAADGGPKILESGEEVNRSMLRAKYSVLDPKTPTFRSFETEKLEVALPRTAVAGLLRAQGG